MNDKSTKLKNKKMGNYWHILLFLILLTLIIISFVFWQNNSEKLAQQQIQIQKKLQNIEYAQQNNQPTIKTIIQKLEQNAHKIDNITNQLENYDTKNPKLIEAVFLLRIANTTLQIRQDIKGAIKLFKQAETIIDSLEDYSLTSVKNAIKQDMVILHEIKITDNTKIWLKLQNMIQQIATLPLISPKKFTAQPSSHQEDSHQENQWWTPIEKALLKSWHFFSLQFQLRKHDKYHPAISLSFADEMHLKQNMRLMLLQTQQAILLHNQNIYIQSLNMVHEWLELYFHNYEISAKNFIENINYLKNLNISPNIPQITHGLIALELYIKNQQTQKSLITPSGESA